MNSRPHPTSRASFATGRYVHQIRFCDNGVPYDGSVKGWGHHRIEAGRQVVSIGKLHYRSREDANGFSEEILPLHVLEGRGDVQGMLRRPPPTRGSTRLPAADAGLARANRPISPTTARSARPRSAGSSAPPTRRRASPGGCSFVCPHFPLVAPSEFFRLYPLDEVPLPRLQTPGEFPDHPVLRKLGEVQDFGRGGGGAPERGSRAGSGRSAPCSPSTTRWPR